jgi:heat shock protein HslJ
MSKHHVLIAIIVILLVGLGVMAWQNYSNQQDAKKVASMLANQENEQTEEPVEETTTEPEEVAPATNLDFEDTLATAGKNWVLSSITLNQTKVDLNVEVSQVLALNFDTDKFAYAGFGGCNTFSGTYTTATEMGFDFGATASTKMACSEQAMQLETATFKAMDAVTKFGIEGEQLVFMTDDGYTKLVYNPAP